MDIRLPQGNGLDLTKTIKTVFADSVICVISSYAMLEYREAAFRNGADHFMVKGESTEVEIVGLVESRLQTRPRRSDRPAARRRMSILPVGTRELPNLSTVKPAA